MPKVDETIEFIKRSHAGQTDKAGMPYWQHPVAVMPKSMVCRAGYSLRGRGRIRSRPPGDRGGLRLPARYDGRMPPRKRKPVLK